MTAGVLHRLRGESPLPRSASRDSLLRGRLALHFGLRTITPAIVFLTLATRPDLALDRFGVAAALSVQVAYGLGLHVLALARPAVAERIVWLGIVADLFAVGVVVHLTGGPGGPLTFLFTLQALAAGVLLSAAVGVRVLALATAVIVALDVVNAQGLPAGELPQGLVAVAALWLVGGAATLFSAFNERELRRRNAELGTVRQIALDIQNTLSIDVIMSDLTRGVTAGLGFDAAAALLCDAGRLRCVASHGTTGASDRTLELRGPLERALTAGHPVAVTSEQARADGALVTLLGGRGYIAVPLGDDGVLVATRAGRNGRPARLRGYEVEALQRLAQHAVPALSNARLHGRVAEMAISDPLTGLANHGEFQRRLAEEIGRLQRYESLRTPGHATGLVLIDIDSFKRFNDRFGHPAGDEVLKGVAAALRVSVRSFDVVARYGGEEFAVVLPETGREGAIHVAERVRSTVAGWAFPPPPGRERAPVVTVSVGVAVAPEHGSTAADLIAAADTALYRSKDRGRNRVTLAKPGDGDLAAVVELRRITPRSTRAGGRAPAASRRARGQSSRPTRRTPRE